jgi:glycosyltransferase involved in cell wall biosynthesis
MINGVAVFTRGLALGLVQRGHEIVVMAPSTTGEPCEEDDGGVRVIRLASTKMPLYPDQINEVTARGTLGHRLPEIVFKNGLNVSYRPYGQIKAVLDEFGPDLVHNQTAGPVSIAILRYCRKRAVPLVTTWHAYPDNISGQMKLPKSLKKPIDEGLRRYFVSILARSAYVTMPTENAIVDIVLAGDKEKKLQVPIKAISNGIDLGEFSPGPPLGPTYERFGLPTDRPLVGIVGRVDREKSMDVLLEAFRCVVDTLPEALLVVAGDGRDRDRLEALTNDLGVADSVRWLGRIDREDLPALYRVFDVFATTSETETQGIVVMEAMASGLPVVGVAAGALGDIIKDGRNGHLVPPRDADAVAGAIVEILQCPKLAEAFGAEALRIVAKHDLGHVLTQFEDLYREVLATEGAASPSGESPVNGVM